MKKKFSFILSAILLISIFTACSDIEKIDKTEEETTETAQTSSIEQIITNNNIPKDTVNDTFSDDNPKTEKLIEASQNNIFIKYSTRNDLSIEGVDVITTIAYEKSTKKCLFKVELLNTTSAYIFKDNLLYKVDYSTQTYICEPQKEFDVSNLLDMLIPNGYKYKESAHVSYEGKDYIRETYTLDNKVVYNYYIDDVFVFNYNNESDTISTIKEYYTSVPGGTFDIPQSFKEGDPEQQGYIQD